MNPARSLDGVISVLEAAGALKRVKRAGWVRVGLPSPESVADHSYRLALMAWLFGARFGLDADKLLRLALIHDLAEARVGDLTPVDHVDVAVKHARETRALADIFQGLPERVAFEDLWREYDAGSSPEARLVRQLDKLEMALQALEYEREFGRDPRATGERPRRGATRQRPRPSAIAWADEFWESARAALTDPRLIEIYDALRSRRPVGEE